MGRGGERGEDGRSEEKRGGVGDEERKEREEERDGEREGKREGRREGETVKGGGSHE